MLVGGGGVLGIWVVGGSWWRAGSGTVLWCGSIWEDTNTGSSFHHAYQHTVQRTHTHKRATEVDADKLLNCVSFPLSTKKRKQNFVGYAR